MTGPSTFCPVTLASAFRPAGFWVGVLLFGPGNLAAQSPFVSGAWCGNVTPTSATVAVRLNAPGLRVRVAVSTNDRLSSAVFSPARTTAAASGNIVKLDVEGLQPATDYDYGIEVAGVLRPETVSRGKFRTFPQGAGSFRLAFSSCGDFQDPDQRAYAAILDDQPLLFVQTGDLHYKDTNTTVAEDYRRNYDSILANRNQGALFRGVALAYVWDDHDFTGDDSNGSAVGAATARSVYREYVPHYPINVTGGTIAQAFTVGRVRVIMSDLHSASAVAAAAESAAKSRLGSAQKAWFKQELIAARDAGFPLILWVSTSPWIDPAQLGVDTWAGFATERTELANFIKDNRIKNLAMLSGDMHALAYDDGANSDYAVGGGAPLVVLHAAPLTRLGAPKGGPYTAGPLPGNLQYGLLDVTDPGGASVQVRFSGKRVDEGAKLTFQFTASTAGIVAGGGAPANGADRAFVNVSTRGRIATAGDALIAGFVLGGTAPRNLLVRAVGPSLGAFGVADALRRPVLTVYRDNVVVASNEDWTATDATRLSAAFDRVGAFRLLGGANPDAALLITLPPGPYTLQATGAGGAVGSVLLEAYDVP
jgi:phosphodiesterase/alkaline phosphatase D-like protein